MKFKGKTIILEWFVVILFNVIFSYEAIWGVFDIGLVNLLFMATFLNLMFTPMLIRNYVIVENGQVKVYLGFMKASIAVHEIKEVYISYLHRSATSVSFRKIVLSGVSKEVVCAVEEEEKFFYELERLNPAIQFR